MKKVTLLLLAFFMIAVVAPSSVYAQEAKTAVVEVKDGEACPDFAFNDINGKEVTLKSLKGKYVLIDVWATWCSPCRGEIPYLKKLEEKMHGKKIVFVSLSVDKDKAAWEKMVADQKLGGVQLHFGGDRSLMEAFKITGIPRFILLDKKGNIVRSKMIRPSQEKEIYEFLSNLKGI